MDEPIAYREVRAVAQEQPAVPGYHDVLDFDCRPNRTRAVDMAHKGSVGVMVRFYCDDSKNEPPKPKKPGAARAGRAAAYAISYWIT